jgi:DNA-binding NarL/FixJ family response regulator
VCLLLIVDDDATLRSVIRDFVEADGYKVCGEAADGVEAIRRAAELQPDLILLDLAMPRLNGAEAASVLRRGMPHVPIVWFTMYADHFGEKLASAVGVDVVLSKPQGMSKLGEHLKILLGERGIEPAARRSCGALLLRATRFSTKRLLHYRVERIGSAAFL